MKAAVFGDGSELQPNQVAGDLAHAGAAGETGTGAVAQAEGTALQRSAGLANKGSATGGKGVGGGGAGTAGNKAQQKLADAFRKSEKFKLLEKYDQFQDSNMLPFVRSARNRLAGEIAAGTKSLQAAEKELTVLLNKAREQTGELVAAMVIMSNFKNAKLVATIPTRGPDRPSSTSSSQSRTKGGKCSSWSRPRAAGSRR